jgi:hypothetical protein
MKKIVVLSAVLLTAFTLEAHAFGFGVQGGLNVLGGPNGLSVLISANEQTHGAVTWYFGKNGITLGGALDYWVLPVGLTELGPGTLSFFLGGGAYAQIEAWEDHFGVIAGLRLPIGLNWSAGLFNVFVQVVPLTGIDFLPSPGFEGFHVDANVGVRILID